MAESDSNNNQNPHEGKVFDAEGYKKALEESGYTIDDAYNYWRAHSDPYAKAKDAISNELSKQLPRVSIKDNSVVISAPNEVLKSPLVKQLQTELKSLTGADLNSQDVINAINALNNELQTTYTDALARDTFGWSEQEYNDYNHLIQVAGTTNPMSSQDPIRGYEKDSTEPVEKTYKDWVEYYRSAYNTDERTNALWESAQSNNPYARTMYLILTQGGDSATYGFDTGEKIAQGISAAANAMGQFPEGVFRTIAEDKDTKKLEKIVNELKLPANAFQNFDINNEQKFDEMKNSISGKSWSELTDVEKAFVLEVGISKGSDPYRIGVPDSSGNIPGDPHHQNLKESYSDNERVSKDAIKRVFINSSFDKYKTVRDNYTTWHGYEDWTQEAEKKLEKSAVWSGGGQWWGNLSGTVLRFLWENAVVHGLTGGISPKSLANPKLVRGEAAREIASRGFSMNKISDKIAGSAASGKGLVGGLVRLGERVTNGLLKKGLNPTSRFGKSTMQFFANLVGTIPEDVFQTAVDNVLTYNTDENDNLLNPEEMSENVKRNFIIMLGWNLLRSGASSIKRHQIMKFAAEQAKLKQPLNIDGILGDADDISRAVDNGGSVTTENGKTVVIDENGAKKVLDNIDEESGKLVQRSLFDMDENSPVAKAGDGGDVDVPGKGKIIVEAETPDGKTKIEVPDYKPKGVDDAISMKVDANEPSIKLWHFRSTRAIMRRINKLIKEMHDKFGDVTVDDFDWVRYNVEKLKKTADEIIGTVDPTTNRVITKEKIAAMEWLAEQPEIKKLREASAASLGKEGGNLLGYLPHSEYSPINDSFDEKLAGRTGVLWEHSTSAAVLDESGNYKGYGGTFRSRYKTFVENMLWDIQDDTILKARLIEEAKMEGDVDLSEEQAAEVLEGAKKIEKSATDAETTKELEQKLTSGEDAEKIDWGALDKKCEAEAQKADMGKATHDVYKPVYANANTGTVVKQRGKTGIGRGFNSLGENMKKTQIEYNSGIGKNSKKIRVSMYDAGGADFVNARGNGLEIIRRIERQGGNAKDLRNALVEYFVGRGTKQKYAEFKVNKIMAKLADAQAKGILDEAKAIDIVGNSLKWEAWGRLRKFIVIARYDDFNGSTKKMINNLMFSNKQTDALTKSQKVVSFLGNRLENLVSFRYKALMYGNVKNALLQLTELNRLFVTFKWGDVAQMMKRMTTDAEFKARVEDYADAIAPRNTRLQGELYEAYSDAADTMEVTDKGVTFKDKLKNKAKTVDTMALSPIETAESVKNHMMIAAIVQEADSKGLTGDAAMRYIRGRFERVALASGKMGQLGYASNPVGRAFLFLQNFQIREIGMHWYNMVDEWNFGETIPKKVINEFKYLTKVLGTKTATLILMARLGYSAEQIYGLDPFGLLGNDYRKINDDQMEGIDYLFDSPLFSGGMLSLLSDLYFTSRKAFEDANPQTPAEEAEEELTGGSSWGIAPLSFDQLMGFGTNFIPGSNVANRLGQMNEMMGTGWATSSSGNKMYSAPENPLDIALGYLFGRSATQNALQYNQTYGDNPLQTLGRWFRNVTNNDEEFDPIDSQNYTDWFKGNENDLQQFNKGRRYFINRRNEIAKTYQDTLSNSLASNEEKEEAINQMYADFNDLFEQVQRFVKAYEDKNGSISPSMVKQLVNLFNVYQYNWNESPESRNTHWNEENEKALERYSSLGLPAIGYYNVPGVQYNPERNAKYKGSPQYQAAINGYYNKSKEAADVLAEVDKDLKVIRDNLKNRINEAYTIGKTTGDYDLLNEIQYEYLDSFDQAVSPIIALYGSDILKSDVVKEQIEKMLSTSSTTGNVNLIPSEQYAKNKRGRYQSMPNQSVDVGEWAQERFSSDIYKQPTNRYDSTIKEDIDEIRRLDSEGKKGRARARALQLMVRINNQRRFLSQEDLKWLKDYLNGGSK